MLKGKTVVVGVCGGIAAYKSCEVVSRLRKLGADVHVIMTEHATEFVRPLTFETLSNNPCVSDMFRRQTEWEVEHISLAKKADLFVVAPATANFVGKFANGIADDMLTTTVMATKAPVLLAPSMNEGMLTSSAFVRNLALLRETGVSVVDGDSGFLACGDNGRGRMAEPESICEAVCRIFCPKRDYEGKRVLVTAGATLERLDAVRFITNFSSGKMGCELARVAAERGAFVTLILARHTVEAPRNAAEIINVETTLQMYDEVLKRAPEYDVVIKAAAPCDYAPENFSPNKIKTEKLTVNFRKNPDIAAAVGKNKGNAALCVFAAETDNLMQNAAAKLKAKNADMIVANDVLKEGAGFDKETNIITIIDSEGATEYPMMSKSAAADVILDRLRRFVK